MFTPVETVEQEPQPALIIHTRTVVQEMPNLLGQIYGKIMEHLGPQAEALAVMPFVAYYNLDMQDLEIDAGFTLKSEVPGAGEIQSAILPGGPQAVCVHYGPYSACGPAYEAMHAWVTESGYEPTGTAYEFYLNDPSTVSVDEIAMRIVFPLKSLQPV